MSLKNIKLRFLEDFSFGNGHMLTMMLILLLAFALRIYGLGTENILYDEAFSISVAKENITRLIERVIADDNPPLYYIILHFWIKIFGDSESSVRFVSVIFGTASVYLIYRVGELIFNKETGILGAFILSISLYSIQYSQEVRFYSLLTLLVLISNYYFIKILKEKDTKYVIGYIISTIALSYTHVFGLFYIMSQNIYYLLAFKRNIRSWIVIQCVVLLFFVPWLNVFIGQTMHIIKTGGKTSGGGIAWITQPTFATVIDTFKTFASGYTCLYLFIVLIFVGMIKLYRFRSPSGVDNNIFLFSWLFGPIAISIVISLTVQPIYVSKYVIASLPALVLLVSKGIFSMRKNLLILIILIILVLSTVSSAERYYNIYNKGRWEDVVSYIDQNRKGDEPVLLFPVSSRLPFEYYYKSDSNFGMVNVKKINNFTKYDKIWLVIGDVHLPYVKSELGLIEKTLASTYTKQYSVRFPGIGNAAAMPILHYYIRSNVVNTKIDQVQFNKSRIINVTGKNTKIAQSFISERGELHIVQLRMVVPTSEVKLYIQTDDDNNPSGNTISSVIAIRPYVSNITIGLGKIVLDPGNRYWIVMESTKGNISLFSDNGDNILKVYDSKIKTWYNSTNSGLYFRYR